MATGVMEVTGGTRVFISDSLADDAEPVYFTPGGKGVTIVDSRLQAERTVRIVSGPDPRRKRQRRLRTEEGKLSFIGAMACAAIMYLGTLVAAAPEVGIGPVLVGLLFGLVVVPIWGVFLKVLAVFIGSDLTVGIAVGGGVLLPVIVLTGGL